MILHNSTKLIDLYSSNLMKFFQLNYGKERVYSSMTRNFQMMR